MADFRSDIRTGDSGRNMSRSASGHHYGLGRIYEMVINNDPCYAYLQEIESAGGSEAGDRAMCMGTAIFFKNNLWFGQTQSQK